MDDLADLYDNAPCGYLTIGDGGSITRANLTLADWMGIDAAALAKHRFADLLTIGTRIFYETHGAPILRLQGHVEELALELRTRSGERIPVFAHATEHVDAAGRRQCRMILVKSGGRRRWERELIDARKATESLLEVEVSTAGLREEFIAVLGHDLRNPLASISAGMDLLLRREPLNPAGLKLVGLVQGSVARMSALIDDVMDFARGRLGGGPSLNVVPQVNLEPLLTQVVDELRLSCSRRRIEADLAVPSPVDCDPSRLGQLVSNLLGNALTHGAEEVPVRLDATVAADVLVLAVSSGGAAIPAAAMDRLFQPFVRGQVRSNQEGLGLGLYIAFEIAKAHGGSLDAVSTDEETRFTLRMPVRSSF